MKNVFSRCIDLCMTDFAENLTEVADIDEYWKEFYEIFGFKIDGVDYGMDCDIQVQIPSLDSAE